MVPSIACKSRQNYRVWIRFDDGLEGEVDLSDLVGKGVFEAWKSVDFFNLTLPRKSLPSLLMDIFALLYAQFCTIPRPTRIIIRIDVPFI